MGTEYNSALSATRCTYPSDWVSSYWRPDGTVYFTEKGIKHYAGYNIYKNGEHIGNVPKK
jgi:hypothetical protein